MFLTVNTEKQINKKKTAHTKKCKVYVLPLCLHLRDKEHVCTYLQELALTAVTYTKNGPVLACETSCQFMHSCIENPNKYFMQPPANFSG